MKSGARFSRIPPIPDLLSVRRPIGCRLFFDFGRAEDRFRRLSREEKTGWKPVPLCGQVPGTGCSDKWFSPSRKGRRQNSAYSPSKISEHARLRIGASFRTGLFNPGFTAVGESQFLAMLVARVSRP